jgi:transposase InsO family protein
MVVNRQSTRPHRPEKFDRMSSTPATRPFDRVSVDLIKLPQTQQGNTYIVVFIDEFTRWPEAMAINDKKAETILRAMKELVLTRHGIPSILLSDEGPEFLNRLVLATCKQYGVTKVFSAAYHSVGSCAAEAR